ENYVKIFSPIEPNKDIIKAGEDTKKGSILVEQGDVLTPGVLGQISSQGIEFVNVYKKPLIGIGVTGSELLNSKEELTPGKIFETNSITFKGIFQNLGFEVKIYDIIPDEEEKIKKFIDESINEVDILVTTGGASVGDYDYAVSTLQDLGGEVLFWKTAMKPGGSIVASRYKNKTILGLSGNPGAAILGMYRVCLPYLKKLLGRRELFSKTIDVILKEDVNKKSPRVRILRGYLEFINGKVYFAEKSFQGNGILSSFIECDCFAEIPAGSYEVKAGTILKAYRVGSIFGSIGE
ncbi:MAG: molybdopterin molybdotransferase MoeA, partial [Tissierellia bacterium]|nr:molybdopterin molybdotransferase MoeA [Tissierellia bacterium]